MIRYSAPDISNLDIKRTIKILRSETITQGKSTNEFEKNLKKKFFSKYCLALNSATSALTIAMQSLNIKKNDIVWVPAITFVASANSAKYFGAKIEFVDIDLKTFNIDLNYLEKKLEISKKNKKLPKILVVVHLGGNPCDLKNIKKICNKYKVKIIEDASHAMGARHKKEIIGNCKYSEITIFSFHAVKMITTGEGGALLTNNKKLYKNAKNLRSHGIIKNLSKKNFWIYDQKQLGYNFRLTDFQSALGNSQLKCLDKFVKKRNQLANYYYEFLDTKHISFQKIDKNDLSSRHLFIVKIKKNKRNQLMRFLKRKKIETNLHYIPIYKFSYYNQKLKLKNSEIYFNNCVSLPLHTKLNKLDIKMISELINKFLS